MDHLYQIIIRGLIVFFLIMQWGVTCATHNRAGNIHVEQIGELTVRATINTWTKTSSVAADRDSLEIFWGDGASEWVVRANGNGLPLDNDVKYNVYIAEHTYPGRGTYTISFTDPNRNGGILNVNWPNSENVQFYLQTTFTFLNTQFQGTNSTPKLLQPPIDIGCIGQPFIHNPNAFDAEGDSLAYELIIPLEGENSPVPLYQFPNQIQPGPNNFHSLDPIKGDFVWTSPQVKGEYNIAMVIREYREGVLISETVRDMQINIIECENMPPELETIDEVCVVAGELLEFEVTATDPDINPVQQIKMQAIGGPLQSEFSPAEFIVASGFQDHPLTGTFSWQTTCEHINDQYYTVIFRAVDDFLDTTGLATLKTVRIKVVGPPPEDVQIEALDDEIELTWFKPYICEDAANDYFQGFSVWRREGSNQFPLDTCFPGLGGKGYEKIEFNTTAMANGRYIFSDPDVERGKNYCYRILAEFARISAGGFPFNRVESLTSEEVCVQLGRDIPLMTNVDIEETDINSGRIKVAWTKPSADDLDTLQNPGPYVYELQEGIGQNPATFTPVPGALFSSPTFAQANDTTYEVTLRNTRTQSYSYQIAFYVNNETEPLGFAQPASSVFLTASPTDEAVDLSWSEEVPWDNFRYVIYRQNDMNNWDSIATTMDSTYRDEGLTNGETYCYYVESVGSYSIDGVLDELRNRSQELCAIPEDNIAPCAPVLDVSNLCDNANPDIPAENFINNLLWTNPNNQCPETDDVASYDIHFTPIEGGPFQIIETITFASDTTYEHTPDLGIAGCYAVTAVDSTGNVSEFSNIVCVDNCPLYELPNAFTPNGDGTNDLYIPRLSRFIARVDMKIFNQWGQLVFETTDPQIQWAGKNRNGNDLAEGVYYYVCKVFEQRVEGIVTQEEILNGYIQLVR